MAQGPSDGGTLVSIVGAVPDVLFTNSKAGGSGGLDGAHQYFCRFGQNPKVPGSYFGDEGLVCVSPPLTSGGQAVQV